jgi:hypothetical protein
MPLNIKPTASKTKETVASVSKSHTLPNINEPIAKEVSPLAKEIPSVRPPKVDNVKFISTPTILPVKANIDKRRSTSMETLTPSADSPDPPNLAKPFATFPAQKTMAQALAGASGTGSSTHRSSHTKPKRVSTPTVFPTKEHAFLVQSIDSVSIHQYLRAVADCVGAKNIWFGSRLSLGRVAIYLTSVDLVNKFMAVHGGIVVGDEFIPARRMVTKASRLIISNVCPTIPHFVLEDILSSTLKLVSPMSFVSVGGKDPELSSIFSFRRQIFVVIEDSCNLPESILVDYEGDRYRVFLSLDDLRCFLCKQTGHVAKNCHVQKTSAQGPVEVTIEDIESEEPSELQNRNKRKEPPSSVSQSDSSVEQGTTTTTTSTEENQPESIDMEIEIEKMIEKRKQPTPLAEEEKLEKPAKQSAKTAKRQKKMETQTLPLEARELLEGRENENAISTAEFLDFLEDVKGNDHPLKVVKKYTENVHGVVKMLETILPKLKSERAIRERVRRLIANIRKIAAAADEDEDNISLARSTSCGSMSSDHLD